MTRVRNHDLRDAHPSWLLGGGADLQSCQATPCPGSLRTTEKYLNALPDAEETALEALSEVRDRSPYAADGNVVWRVVCRVQLWMPSKIVSELRCDLRFEFIFLRRLRDEVKVCRFTPIAQKTMN